MRLFPAHFITGAALVCIAAGIDRIIKNAAMSGQLFLQNTHIRVNNRVLFFIEKNNITEVLFVCFALIFCGILFWKSVQTKSYALGMSAGAIFLGALSNFWDQFVYGGVVDWIAIPGFTVFNIADILVCGGVLFAGFILFSHKSSVI